MLRKYKIVFIDDEEHIIDGIMTAVNNLMSIKRGYEITHSVFKNKTDIESLPYIAADIVLFDCALGGAALDFDGEAETRFGIELMRRFRKSNKRTKIIFYSGTFSLTGTQCYDFTNEEMLKFINELHIFKMIPKKVEDIENAIVEAIDELDSIIMSLEELKEEYHSIGDFVVNDELYSISDLILELKKGSKVGEEFRRSVLKILMTYMMKFGGDEE